MAPVLGTSHPDLSELAEREWEAGRGGSCLSDTP